MRHAHVWCAGRVLPERELRVPVADRTFEHGLGLFETLRTWMGGAALLDRHVDRLTRSAAELDLPLDPASLPDHDAVAALLEANRVEGDALLRITMTGGMGGDAEPADAVLWMRSGPLPAAATRPATVAVDREAGDWIPAMRHKTLNYWARRIALEEAARLGFDECLTVDRGDLLLEACRSSVFVVRDGLVRTPDPECQPVLPGIMRGLVLERAGRLGIVAREERIGLRELLDCDEVFLTNSVRGIMPVGTILGLGRAVPGSGTRFLERPDSRTFPEAPGPITRRLMHDLALWLDPRGTPTP